MHLKISHCLIRFNLNLTPRLHFQEMTSILILVNFWLIYSVFHRIHIVDGFYLQLKIIMVWNISQCSGADVSEHLLW